MNETILNSRQRLILSLISQSQGLGREEIQEKVAGEHPVSRPTIIRDLNHLSEAGLIRFSGRGRSTLYLPFSSNPLLRPFDLKSYFSLEPDERPVVKKQFDFDVFRYLKDLLAPEEKQEIQRTKRSFNGQIERLDPTIFKRELERFTIELSWKSAKIEGNTYTLLETEALLKEAELAPGKTKEEAQMILNHKDAFSQIFEHRQDFKRISLSLVNQLHQTMVRELGITAGIRRQAVGITGTNYRPPDNEHQIREALQKLVVVINKNQHPVEKALIATAFISYIQPFTDGNKRTGRMLANAILMAHDYFPISYRSIREEELKKALIVFYERGSIFNFKKLFLEQLFFSYRNYFK
ncbi:MAG: Fic family protein [Patescibacteria group bacterium]